MPKLKKSLILFLLLSLLSSYIPYTPVANAQTFSAQVVGTTNTQATLKYTAPNSNACTVEVSESSSLSPLVHDVNSSIFTGANLDTRESALSSGTTRIFVIGKRMVEKGLNGNNYSRALQTNTTHYYRITCGTAIASGSFATANIPFGMTYSDGIQNNPEDRSGYMYPTVNTTDRNTSFIDPRTGTLFKPLALKGDGALAYNNTSFGWSSAGFHEWCSPKVSANGFYHCAIPNDYTWMLYGIHQTTGEVRYLGSMHIVGQSYGVTEGFRSCNTLAGIPWDINDPNVYYCGEYSSTGGGLVVLKMTYTGNDQPVTQGLIGGVPTAAALTVTNLTPAPDTLLKQLKDFDPSFNNVYRCTLDGSNMGGYLSISCRRGEQDTFAWIGAFDIQNKKVAGFMKMWEQPNSRWCAHHTYEFLGNSPVYGVATQFAKGGGIGYGPYEVTLSSSLAGGVGGGALTPATITSAWNSAWGTQHPDWQPGDPVSPNPDNYLMDFKVGDLLSHGGEIMEIAEIKSPTEIVLKRGIGKDQTYWYPKSHSAGSILRAYCGANKDDPSNLPHMFWKFLESPKGGATQSFGANFGSHPIHRDIYRVEAGSFRLGRPDDTSTWGLYPTGWVNPSPKFAGASIPADGNYFEKHPTMPYHGIPWSIDLHPFTGGNIATRGSDADTRSLGGNLYQYFYNGLDPDGLNRKQVPTFAFNGNYQMVDISGPNSVIDGSSTYNFTYCIANKAGECVAGSAVGNIYFNVPVLTVGHRYCSGNEFYDGSMNVCIADVPTIGFGISQTKLVTDSVGNSIRVLSKAFAYAHQPGTANVKATPGGSWLMVNSYTGHILLMKIPPIPTSDGVDRTTFVRTPITVTPPTGKGITQAKILFGYEEFGKPNQYYCTSRREACVSTTSTIVDSNPFSFAQTDSYTNVPCTTSCSITLPVLPMRTAYFKVSYLNSSGVEVATDNGVVVERYVAALGSASTNVVSSPTTPTPTPTPTIPLPPPVTIDTTPPVISNIATSDITPTSATVTWNTNELADSQIEYGLTSAYGASAIDGTPVTSHVLKFTNLTPNTKYSYRVTSEDLAGNTTVSYNQIFTTKEVVQTPAPTTPTQTTSTVTGTFASWLYKKVLTINKSQVQGSHTNFPLLVSITDSDLKSVSSGGKVSKTDGTDIFFTNSADTKLSHEIEKYDPATGQLIAWVKVPSLSSSEDTTLSLYFGNASASDQQDKTGVWDSNYEAVFHLNNDVNDSTSNGNNGTAVGSPAFVNGQIGGAANFNGSSSSVTTPTTGFGSGGQSATIQAWIKVTGSGTYNINSLVGYGTNGYMKGFGIYNDPGSNKIAIVSGVGGFQNGFTTTIPNTTSQSVVAQITNYNSNAIYLNGNLSASSGNSYGDSWNISPTNLYLNYPFVGGGYSNAVLDEIRISSTARSADWIKTEYNNQNSPSSFVSVGTTQNVQQTTTEIPPKTAETLGPPPPTGSPAVTFQSVASPNVSSGGGGGGSSSSVTTTATSNTTTNQTTTTQTSTGSISLPRDLVFGAKGSDVTLLQKTLVSSGYLPSDSATGYFGPLTLSAIKKYQQDKGLAGPGDRGWGNVGPQTRAHFAKLSGTTQTINTLTPAQKEAIQAQINSLLTLVAKLMAQLQALQGR